jgi:peptidoglycan/xylan/chitin deacetylase (PgdA/CDA1 family)
MYHSVPARTRSAFVRQIDYMRSLGDFVSPSKAIELLARDEPLAGRYFCITFDDGERDAYENAFPILAARAIPYVSFIVPAWVAIDDAQISAGQYVSWSECRHMAENGATIGSHSLSHRRLAMLSRQETQVEMAASKLILERELAIPCEHFACPWGQPVDDYVVERDPGLAARCGYHSFFTTIRGSADRGISPWAIPRIRLEPNWDLHQLRYLFSR